MTASFWPTCAKLLPETPFLPCNQYPVMTYTSVLSSLAPTVERLFGDREQGAGRWRGGQERGGGRQTGGGSRNDSSKHCSSSSVGTARQDVCTDSHDMSC